MTWLVRPQHRTRQPVNQVDGRQVARWALRRILNRLTELFALAQPEVDEIDHRASGDAVCEVCGEVYRRHAHDPHERTTTLLCDGRRVHL